MAAARQAGTRTTVQVDKPTLHVLHAVRLDMQRDARRNLTLAQVICQLAETWQQSRQAPAEHGRSGT
jgi:hypothetical protein